MGTSIYPLPRADREAVQNKLLYITHSKYENDWPSQPHIHPFAELFYVKDGSGSFLFEEEEYLIEKDDFVIVNAGISHTEISSAAMPLEYVSIGMEGCSFSYQGNKDCILFKCGDDQNGLLFLMNAMLNEMEERNRDCEIVCQNLLEILIIKLVRRINFAFEEAPHIQINKECTKIKRYIEANYTQNITLDSLAEFSHLNKYYMAHAFTLHCGCSPIRYLCETRIKASKGMLANTDYSITEVARYCGFSSQSYFAQCFLKSCGQTASAYRKNCKEKAG
ncbi:MAG: AraC family transcriptional regulator [Lachnospiraceae bacterium]|nr:AraC family transcriptional regulator [Lachnospiraceae bacterium]